MRCTKSYAIAALSILVLLAPIIFLNSTSAQHNLESKSQTLFTLVSQAENSTLQVIRRLEAEEIQVASPIKEKLEAAEALFQEAKALRNEGNLSSALQKADQSMQSYEEVLGTTTELLNQSSSSILSTAESIIRLGAELNRTHSYFKKIDEVLLSAQNKGYNLTRFAFLLNQAKTHLKRAYENLEKLDLDRTRTELNQTNKLITQILELKDTLITNLKLVKAQEFLVNAEKTVTALKSSLTALVTNVQAKNESLIVLNIAESNLSDAKTYLEEGKLDETIAKLETSVDNTRESIRILEDAGITVRSCQTTLQARSAAKLTPVP